MPFARQLISVLLICGLCGSTLLTAGETVPAQDAPPVQDGEKGTDEVQPPAEGTAEEEKEVKTSSQTYGFSGKESLKLGAERDGWEEEETEIGSAELTPREVEGLGQMLLADCDGDGRKDIFFLSRSTNKFHIFWRKDDYKGFERTSYDLDEEVGSAAVGDVNHDGRIDLLVIVVDPKSRRSVLKAIFGKKDRKFGQADKTDIEARGVRILDLSEGDTGVIFLFYENNVLVTRCGKDGSFAEPVKYPNANKGSHLEAADVTGDGRPDVLLLGGGETDEITVRPQMEDSTLGSEIGAEIEGATLLGTGDLDGDGRAEFLCLHKTTRALKVYRLLTPAEAAEQKKEEKKQPFRFGPLEATPFDKAAASEDKGIDVGDINGDGRADAVVTDGANARLLVWLQDARGRLAAVSTFSTFADAAGPRICNLLGDARPEVVVLSHKDKVIGISRTGGTDKLVSFPEPVKTEFEPTAIAPGDFNGDGRTELAYASTDAESETTLLTILGADEQGKQLKELRRWKLDKKEGTTIKEIRPADLNGDGRLDFVAFFQYGPDPGFFIQKPDGSFENVVQRPGFQKGFVKKLRPNLLTVGDIDGDGAAELVISEKSYAKVLKIDAAGNLVQLDQYGGKEPGSRITGSLVADLDGDGTNELILQDSEAEGLSILARKPPEGMKIERTVKIGRIAADRIVIADLDGDKKNDILLLAPDKLGIHYADAVGARLEATWSFRTKIRKGRYTAVRVGDVNGDGSPDVVLVDGARHHIEILSVDKQKKELVQQLTFPTYRGEREMTEDDGERFHRFGRDETPIEREPSQIELSDLNGDGKIDIVTRLHNYVIIYFQE